ncbi:MAG: hypothetical protein SVR81_03785 [Chloroflexota bacterium]|nr:hypothetical protein [Chloroflexota bacterium]
MGERIKGILGGLALMIVLTACAPAAAGGEAFPLAQEPYTHPSGIFTIPNPEGWSVLQGETDAAVWVTPPEDGPDVKLVLIGELLPGATEDEMADEAQEQLGEYMAQYLPYEDYEIYNNAEIRVNRNPALLLDFARQMDDDYHVGRMVLIYLPGHLVYLAGFGPRTDWDAFLPTFRAMVDEMTFSIEPLMLDD